MRLLLYRGPLCCQGRGHGGANGILKILRGLRRQHGRQQENERRWCNSHHQGFIGGRRRFNIVPREPGEMCRRAVPAGRVSSSGWNLTMSEVMDRRVDIRVPTSVPVQFSLIGPKRVSSIGHIRDVSEGGLKLSSPVDLTPGNFVRIEVEDSILFGEVKYCCPWAGGFVAGLLIEQMLLGRSEMSHQVAAALREAPNPASAAPQLPVD